MRDSANCKCTLYNPVQYEYQLSLQGTQTAGCSYYYILLSVKILSIIQCTFTSGVFRAREAVFSLLWPLRSACSSERKSPRMTRFSGSAAEASPPSGPPSRSRRSRSQSTLDRPTSSSEHTWKKIGIYAYFFHLYTMISSLFQSPAIFNQNVKVL